MLLGLNVQIYSLGALQSRPCSLTEKGWNVDGGYAWDEETSGLLMALRDEGSLSCVPCHWLFPDVLCVCWEKVAISP